MTSCNDWYLKYNTLQECLDEETFKQIPVDMELTTVLATTQMTTTRTTAKSTSLMVTVDQNTDLVESIRDLADIFIEDDTYEGAIEDKEEPSPVFGINQKQSKDEDVLVRAEVKGAIFDGKGAGFDGKLLGFFISVEFVGGAMLLVCLYKGMKYVADLITTRRQYNNLENSGLPLNQNPAPNPEDTIVPNNRDDEIVDRDNETADGEDDIADRDDTAEGFTTANLDSTRVDQTQMTRLSQFSPIGQPQLNRTVSFNDLPSTSKERRFPKSPSQPITFNLDTDGFDLDASALLRLPTVPTLNQIIGNDAASVRDDTAVPSAATVNQPAPSTATANAVTPGTSGVTADKPSADKPSAITTADDEDSNGVFKRRYPDRKRSPPKRYGW